MFVGRMNVKDLYPEFFKQLHFYSEFSKDMSREGYYWRLRDKSLSWTDRVKLARHAWKNDTVPLPNKHQMLIDWIVYALGETKKCSSDDRSSVWMCFHDILHTNKCHSYQLNGQPLKLKLLVLAKIIVAELEVLNKDHSGKNSPCGADVIIACCTKLVVSPTLGNIFSGHDGQLLMCLSLVLKLCHIKLETSMKALSHDLVKLTETLLDNYLYILQHRSVPKMNLKNLNETLLETMIKLLYRKSSQHASSSPDLGANSVIKLENVLFNVLCHRELKELYKIFLQIKVGQNEGSEEKSTNLQIKVDQNEELEEKSTKEHKPLLLPMIINGTFKRIDALLSGEVESDCNYMKSATYEFLPCFLRRFVIVFKDSALNMLPFLMLKYLVNDTLKINLSLTTETPALESKDLQVRLKVLNELLKVMLEMEVYNIIEDTSGEQVQLIWYKSLASWILRLESSSEEWYNCLTTLLELNHSILEPKLSFVVTKTITSSEGDHVEQRDVFLRKLVLLFDMLHQFPKFITRVIAVLKESKKSLEIPKVLLDSVSECVTGLPFTTVYDLWYKLMTEFGKDREFAGSIAPVFSSVLMSTHMTEHNMERLSEMSTTMWEEHFIGVLEVVITEGDVAKIASYLNLLFSFGEVQILLKYYHPLYTVTCPQFFNSDALAKSSLPESSDSESTADTAVVYFFDYTYPGVVKEFWERLGKLVEEHQMMLLTIWIKFLLQHLKAVQLFEDASHRQCVQIIAQAVQDWITRISSDKSPKGRQIRKELSVLVYNHLHLFNNYQWKDMKQCRDLLALFTDNGLSLAGCQQFEERHKYHQAFLMSVKQELMAIREEIAHNSASSPKKRRKQSSSSNTAEMTTAAVFVQVMTDVRNAKIVDKLDDSDRSNLLAVVLTQDALPFEFLSEENSAMSVSNILTALLIQNESVLKTSVQLKLVRTCYNQFEAVLTNFNSWSDWLEPLNLVDLLQFLMSLQGRIEHQDSTLLDNYLRLADFLLHPLLKKKDGLSVVKLFVEQLKTKCLKYSEDVHAGRLVMATSALLLKCLSQNLDKSTISPDVLTCTKAFYQTLCAASIAVVGKVIVLDELRVADSSVIDVYSIMVAHHCKSKVKDANDSKITSQLAAFSTLCIKTLKGSKLSTKINCVKFMLTICENYTTLQKFLPDNFIEDTWNGLLCLSRQQEMNALYTSHTHCNQGSKVKWFTDKDSSSVLQYNVSSHLNSLLKTLNSSINKSDEKGKESVCNQFEAEDDESLESMKDAGLEESDSKEKDEVNEDVNTSKVLDVNVKKVLGLLISIADDKLFENMLGDLLKDLGSGKAETNLTLPTNIHGTPEIQDISKTSIRAYIERKVDNDVSKTPGASGKKLMPQTLFGEAEVNSLINSQDEVITPEKVIKSSPSKVVYKEEITAVQGREDILSNFYPCQMKYKSLNFNSSGQAYEYCKALHYKNKQLAGQILFCESALDAKRIAKGLRSNSSWDKRKEKEMKSILDAKADGVPEFRKALLKAGRVIVEAVRGDMYWSPGLDKYSVKSVPQKKWPGKNVMGKLLMALRDRVIGEMDTENADKLPSSSQQLISNSRDGEKNSSGRVDTCTEKVTSLKSGGMCSDIAISSVKDNKKSPVVTENREKLTAFQGSRDILSNFYSCHIRIWGNDFKSTEQAYYYKKAIVLRQFEVARNVLSAQNAAMAKKMIRNIGTNPSWEGVKDNVMEEILRCKLVCCPKFKEALCNAGDMIVEAVPGSLYWSAGLDKYRLKLTSPSKWPGENRLGKLMMRLRDELLGELNVKENSRSNIKSSAVPVKTPQKEIKGQEQQEISEKSSEKNHDHQGNGSGIGQKRKRNEDCNQQTDKVLAFNGENEALSNFYKCEMTIGGVIFHSSQHAYYYKRALHANRFDLMQSILKVENPSEIAEKMDCQFTSRDDEKWEKCKGSEMMKIIECKSRYVPEFHSALISSGDCMLAEANTNDQFWSAGLDKDSLELKDMKDWPGKNVYGRLLMGLRKRLQSSIKSHSTVTEEGLPRKRIKSDEIDKDSGGNDITGESVTVFQGAGDVLSNFYPCKIDIWEKSFTSSEHAYQYKKAMYSHRKDSAHLIMHSPSALGAKRLAREITTTSMWEASRVDVMREILQAKSKCVPEFKQTLLNAENTIAEAVAKDLFWSCGLSKADAWRTDKKYWPGKNVMGELHMELRAGLLQDVVEDFDDVKHFDESTKTAAKTMNSIKVWQELVTYKLSKHQKKVLKSMVQQVVLCIQQLLITDAQHSKYQIVLYVTALNMLATFLKQGTALLPAQSVINCLHGCIQAPLRCSQLDVAGYAQLHTSVYTVLSEMLLRHSETTCQCVASYLTAIKPFLACIIARGKQGEMPVTAEDESALVSCAGMVDRLFTLVASHSVEFSKVATYIIADYVSEVKKVTLLPAVKKALLPGIYQILKLCDVHGVAQLYTILPQGPKEIFRGLHQEYNKYYKYTGKV